MHPLHYFPCVNAFADLLNATDLQLDVELPFKRSSFRNRMIIAGATGPITLSIPVVGGRNVKLPYKEVEIDYTNSWQRDHFRTLCTVYGNSPFFQFYKNELEHLFNTNKQFLYDWNFSCLNWVFKKMKFSPAYIEENQDLSQLTSSSIVVEYLPSNYKTLANREMIAYNQVFQDKTGFLPNISIIDLLFNEGTASLGILLNANAKLQSNSLV